MEVNGDSEHVAFKGACILLALLEASLKQETCMTALLDLLLDLLPHAGSTPGCCRARKFQPAIWRRARPIGKRYCRKCAGCSSAKEIFDTSRPI